MAKAGFQRKTQKGFLWFGVVLLLGGTAALLGGALALAVDGFNGPQEDRSGALIAAGFLLFMAGICAPFAYILLRKAVPRKAKHLALSVSDTQARRGDTLTARLDVLDPDKVSGAIDVTLRCTAFYDVEVYVNGNRSSQTREKAVHEQRHEVNGHGPQEFRFELPADGPFSYEGTNLSMVWQVVARDPQPRRTDRTLVQPVQVLP